jgi:hypothetical protein
MYTLETIVTIKAQTIEITPDARFKMAIKYSDKDNAAFSNASKIIDSLTMRKMNYEYIVSGYPFKTGEFSKKLKKKTSTIKKLEEETYLSITNNEVLAILKIYSEEKEKQRMQ